MTTKPIFLTVFLIACCCNGNQKLSNEELDHIFTTQYRQPIISKGDNIPDFDRRKDSINLFLVALHHKIKPETFQKKAGWSDEMMKEKIQLLTEKGWLASDDKGLRPTVFIASDNQGKELFEFAIPLATQIANSIEAEVPSIREKFKSAGLSGKYEFDSMSFLVLSNVLLDNWQIMNMEAEYLKKENRPERHGKFYYASIMEHADIDYEPFGIYGNQFGKINDSTYMSIYGKNRIIVNEKLKSNPSFGDSIYNNALLVSPDLYNLFDGIAKDYLPDLLRVLNEQNDYSHEVYEKSGYADEITYEEFFIWWYHFIYTTTTDILAKRNLLSIPRDGNFYYKD